MYKERFKFQICFNLVEKQVACFSNLKYVISQGETVIEVTYRSDNLPIGVYNVSLTSDLSKKDDQFVKYEIKEAVEFDYYPKMILQDDMKEKVRIRFN